MTARRAAFVILALIAAGVWADDPPLIAPGEARSPADEARAFRLPPGFVAQLVAAEPEIHKPINLAFDSRGRLWVTSSIEYPFAAKGRAGRDTVTILDDFGPDGRARRVTTFADGLNIPIGLLPDVDAGGAIVFSITPPGNLKLTGERGTGAGLWHLRDTDGDGKADSCEPVLTGFGTRDTHGMVNGLVRGFDGWIYACHGYLNDSAVQARDSSRIVMNSGHTFRFRPGGERVELVCRGQVNPFGMCLDPWGNLYTACCHSKPITQLLRGAVFTSFAKPHDGLGFGPDMIRDYRGSTALCGLAWYDAGSYPPEYRGRLFLGDVVNNCVNIFDVERQGASYLARQHKDDFLKSDDPWFRPVDIKLGPDGALYIADFYNRIIGHYEVPLDHPGRDRTSGRIWRIVYTGGGAPLPAAPTSAWTSDDPAKSVADLGHPNMAIRMLTMSRLIHSLGRTDATLPALTTAAKTGSPIQRVHALWLLEQINRRDRAALEAALNSPEALLRVHALRILAEQERWADFERESALRALRDRDALVRRVAVDAVNRHPSSEALEALIVLRREPATVADEFLMHTVRMAIRDHLANPTIAWPPTSDEQVECLADAALGTTTERAANFVAAHLATLANRRRSRAPEFLHYAARYSAPSRLDSLPQVIQSIAGDNAALAGRLLLAWSRGLAERGANVPEVGEWPAATCRRLIASESPGEVRLGFEAAVALRQAHLANDIAAVIADRRRPEDLRAAACSALPALGGPTHLSDLAARLTDGGEAPAVREKAAEALAQLPNPAARTALIESLKTAPARLASAIAAALAANRDGATALLDAVAKGQASPRLLLERPIRARLDALKSRDIHEQVMKLTAGLPPADAAILPLLQRRAQSFRDAQPNAEAGAKLFQQHCGACHQVAGQGTRIGPHLDGIGVRGVERLLEDILDPNRNVDPAFRTTTLALLNGTSVSGLLLREEGAVLVLADAQGKEFRVEQAKIESRSVSPLSPMPSNWAEVIPERDFNDLLAYLLTLRR